MDYLSSTTKKIKERHIHLSDEQSDKKIIQAQSNERSFIIRIRHIVYCDSRCHISLSLEERETGFDV